MRAGDAVLQLEVPVAEVAALAARARACGASVVLNAAPAVALPETLLSAVDVLIVNESEAAAYAAAWRLPAAPAAFIPAATERFGLRVVVTLGARGAMTSDAGAIANLPPPDVAVVDTTGAGDAFAGALPGDGPRRRYRRRRCRGCLGRRVGVHACRGQRWPAVTPKFGFK